MSGATTFLTVADSDILFPASSSSTDNVNLPCGARPVTRSSNLSPWRIPPDSSGSGSEEPLVEVLSPPANN